MSSTTETIINASKRRFFSLKLGVGGVKKGWKGIDPEGPNVQTGVSSKNLGLMIPENNKKAKSRR